MKDPYKVLEIDRRASELVIKAAYHALIKENHPDKDHGSEKKTKELNAAYEILSDASKRKIYDDVGNDKTGTVIGSYKLLEAIADGGFGSTYKAEHLITGDLTCIKHCSTISATHDSILIEETRSIWDLRHYGLPAMRDLLRLDDGSLALVMSYIPGPTLEEIVDKAGKIEPENMAWITERLLNILLYLHHHGVIHGDIKPQNIIIQPATHSVVMVDFGLAMVKPGGSEKAMGYTPVFASPEQVAGKTLLPASDYYSLGMVMLYGLNGGKNMNKKQVPTTVPDALSRFVNKLIQSDVLSRPQRDLYDDFVKVRLDAFGRSRSGMKNIPGFNS